MAFSCTVLGASGYSGGELVRLLNHHPALNLVAAGARGRSGHDASTLAPHLVGLEVPLGEIAAAAGADVDVCFSCLPSGVLDPAGVGARILIDLSDDKRADEDWAYGLTEWNRPSVQDATRIANPGCYPTATLLALLPFIAEGVVEGPIGVDAMSGVSGAGRKAEDHLSFATLDGSATAYGTTAHRHIPEMERGLATFGGSSHTVSFTPHLVPMARGLLMTARASLARALTEGEAMEILHSSYADEPFVHVVDGWPQTKAVAGSNHAHVTARVDERSGMLICNAVIDNLGKGAAGQALQNANLALGIEESTGLDGLGVWP